MALTDDDFGPLKLAPSIDEIRSLQPDARTVLRGGCGFKDSKLCLVPPLRIKTISLGENKMQISVMRPSELGPGEIALWHSMQRQSNSLANPFLCPEFAVAIDKFRTDARVAVLTDGPEIAGFFPFQRRSFGTGVPIGAGLTDCQGLIHAPGLEWDARELLWGCRLSAWQFDHLVEGQWPFERYAVTVASSPVIDLTGGSVVYKEKLRARSPQFCRDLARKARKLEREAGELRFVVDSRDAADLHALISWKSNQYHRNGWINRFDRPWVTNLIDYLFSMHTDNFGGILSILYVGERPIAAHFGLISGHVVAHWFPAYDTDVGRQSPGLIQHLRMAEEMAALDVHIIDLGTGAERYKQTLKSYDLLVSEGMVTRGALSAAAHSVRSTLAGWARRRIKQHPVLFRAADRMLRHYGRISLADLGGNECLEEVNWLFVRPAEWEVTP